MTTEELVSLIVNALEDVKAQDIRVYDTTDKTSAFERVIVASGTSNRQTRALGLSAARAVKENGGKVSGLEGLDSGEWVLVDCGSVVCHCLQPAVRDYYNLEEIWGGKEVFMKASEECASRLMPHRPGHLPEDLE